MLAAFTLMLTMGSSAAPEPSWTAPAGCPDRARGTELLQRFLGRPPPVPVRVVLSAEARGYAGLVEIDGAARTLHASDCETLARAVALVVAVSLDPVAAASMTTESESEPTPGPDPGRGVPEPESRIPEPDLDLRIPEPDLDLRIPEPDRTASTPTRGRRPVLASADRPPEPAPEPTTHAIALSGGAGLALLPAPTGAARLGHAITRGGFRLQTDLTYAPPRTIAYPDEPTVGGRFQSVSLGVRACFVPGSARVVAPLCAGLEGGPLIGRGVGIDQARNPVDAWVGGLASGAVVVRVHARVALTATAEVIASLRRPAFHVGSRGTLFRVPQVGLRGLLGLELRAW
ncbi:hypothetical protein [Paraliomyxa miuraensis]|uniref:hypothetical protein n=1 Tax=Paraliomyxa miuraensis TaxID=376150 RepID=UPI00225817F0|nr:hypothetical protein [Paraliomyxa miuraensis]MCX4248091.1 hypothetical protein [Paraliomyxa miuraensis]